MAGDLDSRVKVLEDALLKLTAIIRDGTAFGVRRHGDHPVDAILQAIPGGASVLKQVKQKVDRVKCEVCGDSIPEVDYPAHLAIHQQAMETA